MENINQAIIHRGKAVRLYKDPGFYTVDFYPLVCIRIPEDEIKNVIKDLKSIIKKLDN